MQELETYSQITNEFDYLRIFTNEAFLRGNSGVAIARSFSQLEKELRENGNTDKAKKLAQAAKENLEEIFKDFNYATELKLLATGYDVFFRNVPNKHQSENFLDNAFKNKYDFNKIAKQIFTQSQMLEPEKAYKLIDKMDADQIANDPMFMTYVDFINNYNTRMQAAQPAYAAMNTTQRMFVKGIM